MKEKKKKNQSTYTFFKATREVRASSYRYTGKRDSTLHFRCSSWQLLQGRGVMPQEPGRRGK